MDGGKYIKKTPLQGGVLSLSFGSRTAKRHREDGPTPLFYILDRSVHGFVFRNIILKG